MLKNFLDLGRNPINALKNLEWLSGPITLACQIFISMYTCCWKLRRPRNGCRKQGGKTLSMIFEILNQKGLTIWQIIFFFFLQIIEWVATGLTELVTIGKKFERILGQDYKQESAKLITSQLHQLQGQRPKLTPRTSPLHASRGSLSKHWPRN